MAGILSQVDAKKSQLNERKEFLRSLRQKEPEKYVSGMQQSTERLARTLDVAGTRRDGKMLTSMRGQQRDQERAAVRQQVLGANTNLKLGRQSRLQQETIVAIKLLDYNLGNSIEDLKNTLAGLLKKQLKLLDSIDANGGGGLFPGLLGGGRGKGGKKPKGNKKPRRGKAGLVARAAEKAKGRGARVLGSVKNTGSKVLAKANTVGKGFLTGGKSVLSKGAGLLGSIGGKLITPVVGGIAAYNVLSDDSKDKAEKSKGLAGVGGGIIGSAAASAIGGSIGAVVGGVLGSVVPVVGTAIGATVGGVVGEIGGGIVGYMGGEKLVNGIVGTINKSVETSGLGDIIGRTAAIAMAPFNEEARASLVTDFNANILPGFAATFVPLQDALTSWGDKITSYVNAFKTSATDIKDGLVESGSSILGGVQNAFRVVSKAYDTGGLSGATNAVFTKAPTEIAKGGREARKSIDAAFLTTGATLGAVSEKYESGGKGVGTVSTGKGDAGGASYGKYQLSSKTAGGGSGTLNKFLASEEGKKYGEQLSGLAPGSEEFNSKYKQIALTDRAGFEKAQHDYISRTHYAPQAQKIKDATGLDVSKRGRAVQEAVFSTAVQYGPNKELIVNALEGKDTTKMTDGQIIEAIQNYKAANVQKNFVSSSPAVRASVANRIASETKDLQALSQSDVNSKPYSEAGAAASSVNKPYVREVASVGRVKGSDKNITTYVDQLSTEDQKAYYAKKKAAPTTSLAARAVTSTPKTVKSNTVAPPMGGVAVVPNTDALVASYLPSGYAGSAVGSVETPKSEMERSVKNPGGRPVMSTAVVMGSAVLPTRPIDGMQSASVSYQEPIMAMESRITDQPRVRAGGYQTVSPGTPEEVNSVRVVNQPEQQVAQAETRAPIPTPTRGKGIPSITEVPLFFPDKSMVPILVGRV